MNMIQHILLVSTLVAICFLGSGCSSSIHDPQVYFNQCVTLLDEWRLAIEDNDRKAMQAVYQSAPSMELSPELAEIHVDLLEFFEYQLECSADGGECSPSKGIEIFNEWAGPARYLSETSK
jgi:hypothetical protein